jgi:hypothetical protein
LAALGITEISVTAQVTSTQDHGNTIGLTSSYRTSDGARHLAGDVWFAAQDVASYAALSALSTVTVAALRTDQLSALSTVQLQALTTADLAGLQTQDVAALGRADALAPMVAGSVPSNSTYAAQVASVSDSPLSEPARVVSVALASGVAQRASALAQFIGTFELAGGPRGVPTPSLNAPVDPYGAITRTATLAVDNLVDQMRSFESQAVGAAAGQAGMGTAAPSALTAMQAPPMGMLDPFKKPSLNDDTGLSGISIKR